MLFQGSPNGITPSRLMLISLTASILSFAISINIASPINAQKPGSPTSSPTSTSLPTIQIESHEDGQQVQAGELTIEGTSSDSENTDCLVSADVNDITPMRNVTAVGSNGGDDFSMWTYTYTDEYQLIKEGENELTAKISCSDANGNNPVSASKSEWHTVNVTGVATTSSTEGLVSSSPSLQVAPRDVPIENNEEKEEGVVNAESFQDCLSDNDSGEKFPTKEGVQDCIESSYPQIENDENALTESTDDDNGDTENAPAGDSEDE